MNAGPLSEIRVLDLSRVLAGPWAAQLLGDLGAEVIKIERPGQGDDSRLFGPPFLKDRDGHDLPESPMFLSANRNKKSVTIDISSSTGQEIIRGLAAQSDVLLENFRSGHLASFGLDSDSLRRMNPRLIYCSITGFGQTGPYRERGGYDPIIQAMSGMMSVTGYPDHVGGGGPMKAGPSIVDLATGLYASMAIQASLYERDVCGGGGQHIDISLLDAAVALMAQPASHYFVSGKPPGRIGTQANGGAPGGGFRCSDGYIMIAPGNQELYRRFCGAIGRPDLADDPRFATNPLRLINRAALAAILDDVIGLLTVAELHAALVRAGVPSSPVNDMAQVFADPQVRARGMQMDVAHPAAGSVSLVANPMRFSNLSLQEYTPPPRLGEHTREVLRARLGFDEEHLTRLAADGVI
jgi:crotonobetainyl-CoA:carnitine CoA-transferase CaiB-like acyl-CoA transferase